MRGAEGATTAARMGRDGRPQGEAETDDRYWRRDGGGAGADGRRCAATAEEGEAADPRRADGGGAKEAAAAATTAATRSIQKGMGLGLGEAAPGREEDLPGTAQRRSMRVGADSKPRALLPCQIERKERLNCVVVLRYAQRAIYTRGDPKP